jgi:hypothetical protein
VGPRAGIYDVERRKILPLPGLELRPLGNPAGSQSLHRLRRVDGKGKSREKRDTYCGEGHSIVFLEGSQASPARPSGKDSVEVKGLRWLEVVACVRGKLHEFER